MSKRFTLRGLMGVVTAFAIGLSAGLYWSHGPAWATYYHQGYRDGWDASKQAVRTLNQQLRELPESR